MTNLALSQAALEQFMDCVDQPMFLLSVDGASKFKLEYLNEAHTRASTLASDAVRGRSPHELFPVRLADTVVYNYEICRAAGRPHTYEENIELPGGNRWWQTTLTPIGAENGTARQILGLAVDVTERMMKRFDAEEGLARAIKVNEELQVFAASSAQDMRGPFETMLALLQMVQTGFVDLGDEKGEQLALCIEIAEDAINSMGRVLQRAANLKASEPRLEQCDLGHLLRDIAAQIDPEQRLALTLPYGKIHADRVAVHMALRALLENAARYAEKLISVSVGPDAKDPTLLRFVVSDDGRGKFAGMRADGSPVLNISAGGEEGFGLNSVKAVVEARGGKLSLASESLPTGGALAFTLPGKLAGEMLKPTDATLDKAPVLKNFSDISLAKLGRG